ncbi:MAG: translation elongation factor 4 [Verrucomicrobiota bacterium]|jgi:GTP-binding protein LepA|nr:translation elongation factor 4 [Verrucomicrobiota bacterium]MDD8046806.1 translation elongation factor 4 [Verrucomicrobiota bacterium]HCF96569.1 elongation factor 4 [Verrucomicrobiota bacterium]
MDRTRIRNFCIIAHIDHGKSTLADRLLLRTGTIVQREFRDQVLDAMDLERERGITIRAHPVTMNFRADDGTAYELNLIDTPGHVDFSYEVSRSLAACEGALLLVDAAQGVEAQTVANVHLAMQLNLTIIPVINKIDLPAADVERVCHQIEDMLAIPREEVVLASAKEGIGTDDILKAIIDRIPAPAPQVDTHLRAMVYSASFDTYRGVVTYIRVKSGTLRTGMHVDFMRSGAQTEVKELGIFAPQPIPVKVLKQGQVGYLIGSIKSLDEIKIGDTITDTQSPAPQPLPGFKEVQPMVFSGIYPINTSDYEALKQSIDKLRLNDPALVYQAENSIALGFGFRCGFLGLLHMEIVQERLRREYDMDIISTYPSVVYKVVLTSGEELDVDNPMHLPEVTKIKAIKEPLVEALIIIPSNSLGDVMQLIREKRGECTHTESVDSTRIALTVTLPLSEILVDFNDRLKSMTRGFGSMDYHHKGFEESHMVKLDLLVNGESVDAFSCIVHSTKAQARGRNLVSKLKEVIPQQLYQVALQAAIGGKIIARENVRALRKNVTAKCYGGDITRKRKLLEKQKEGKKRMKQVGKVNIPQEAFISVLKA